MSSTGKPKRFRDLLVLLGELARLHEELCGLLSVKIEAMKRADTAGLLELQAPEAALTQRIAEREGLRKQLMDVVAREWGLNAKPGRTMTVSEMQQLVSEPDRSALLSAVEPLRAAVGRAESLHRVASLVTRTILLHLQWVIGAMSPTNCRAVAYADDGKSVCGSNLNLFETVG